MKDNVFEDGPLDALGALQQIRVAALPQPVLATATSSPVMPGIKAPAPARPAGVYRVWGKRLADIVLVILSAPMVLLVTLLCAVALWIEGGQPFYRQDRLGASGKRFSIFKLRTMCRDADQLLEQYLANDPALRAEWDSTQKLKQDPRITRVGAFLRKASLDELPQFWNVLRGEMSIVGPRPMMPEQLLLYPDPAPYFDMRPGITGLWQVSDRNNSSFAHRSTVDAQYHAHLSLREDVRILFKTVDVVMQRTGY